MYRQTERNGDMLDPVSVHAVPGGALTRPRGTRGCAGRCDVVGLSLAPRRMLADPDLGTPIFFVWRARATQAMR